MAIDSERKRKSAAWIGAVFSPPTIVADGSIIKADRQTIGWGYYGIAAASPAGFVAAWARFTNVVIQPGYGVRHA